VDPRLPHPLRPRASGVAVPGRLRGARRGRLVREVVGVRACALIVVAALALAGCGLGAGSAPSAVNLTVTRDFGETVLPSKGPLAVVGQETDMSLLERNYSVQTRFGGGFVQSVDGVAGGREGGHPVDWFYYVNGVEATKGAAATDVHPGDHIWWDRHDWSQTEDVPAVVGSFPEPFLNGIEGKRLPVRVECAPSEDAECQTVSRRLQEEGVPAAISGLAQAESPDTIRILVGPWTSIRDESGPQEIEQGPRASGVYARMSTNGASLAVLGADGNVVRTLGAGAGLIAATRHAEEAPVWLVTGTDKGGVKLAAASFDAQTLQDHFAVAVTTSGSLALPAGG